jgi:hypothetical protein
VFVPNVFLQMKMPNRFLQHTVQKMVEQFFTQLKLLNFNVADENKNNPSKKESSHINDENKLLQHNLDYFLLVQFFVFAK